MPKTRHQSEEAPEEASKDEEQPSVKKQKPAEEEEDPQCAGLVETPLKEDESGTSVCAYLFETTLKDDQSGTSVNEFLAPPDEDAGEGDVSQNKNPSFLSASCRQGVSGSGVTTTSLDHYWPTEHISTTSHFDHAVDDPLFWGPYLSERQWGTVREDYSDNDNSWEHVSYEDATFHTYVSGEDGLLGASDKRALLCMSVALWNGKDPMLKERLFGLTGIEGNHGEDVKELYYYLDNLPDHSYMRALYKYPHCPFPYQRLREENKNRTFSDLEFELTDTGIFEEGGHWDVEVEYAKLDCLGLACHLKVTNCSRQEEVLHLIPQFWFRHIQKNEPVPNMTFQSEPQMKAMTDGTVRIRYHFGSWRLIFMQERQMESPMLLFTDNQSPVPRDHSDSSVFTKDAFHQFVVHGKGDAVNPLCAGTKCGAYYKLTVAAGSKVSVYWRIESLLNQLSISSQDLIQHFDTKRQQAADFYSKIMPEWSKEERNIGIQALAGLMWSKQYYCFDVKNWLRDYRRCRQNTGTKGRNSEWSHAKNYHILLMPDKWEFPWYAGWDLCISAVLAARFCPKFAKHQMLAFLSDNFMHRQGQLPGCEFDLGDPNPPLQAWAVLQIFHKDGSNDTAFLRKCFHRLLLNYNWWCNKEFGSSSTYGRGFLGMDNISVIDRSGCLPPDWSLVQADCTGWVACFALWMLVMALELARTDLVYCDLITRFLLHFLNVAAALNRPVQENGLWHEEDRFTYDVFHTPEGPQPIRLRSMAGLVPLLACAKITLKKYSTAAIIVDSYINDHPQFISRPNDSEVFLSVLSMPRVRSVLDRVFAEEEFFSPYGIRSLSKVYEEEPFSMQVGEEQLTVKYTPGESDSGAFGGNSNWRGPVWVVMNYLLLESLDVYLMRASAARSNLMQHLPSQVRELEQRLLTIFLPDKEGRRPVHGMVDRYAVDPKWRHLVLFYEYIHADTGRGCGASHQTGWTAAIMEIIYRIHRKS